MREEGADQCGGVMHCFTEAWETARAALDLGFYISFSGILTFKSAGELREVARRVPIDRVLVETDSPYLAPVPHRGKLNQPCFVGHVADVLARVLDTDRATIDRQTTENFFNLFKTLRS
jgi:TatD DNase family protein